MKIFGVKFKSSEFISLASLLILALTIPLVVFLLHNQQIFKSRASEKTRIEVVNISGAPITQTATTSVKLKLTYVAAPTGILTNGLNWGLVKIAYAAGISVELKSSSATLLSPDSDTVIVSASSQIVGSGGASFIGNQPSIEVTDGGKSLIKTNNQPSLSGFTAKLTPGAHTINICAKISGTQKINGVSSPVNGSDCKSYAVTVQARPTPTPTPRPTPTPSPTPSPSPSPTPTPSPTPSPSAPPFPLQFRVANSEGGLAQASEQSFATNPQTINWELPPGDGVKTVYAQFKIGNVWQETLTTTVNLVSAQASATPSPLPSSSQTTTTSPTPIPSVSPSSSPTAVIIFPSQSPVASQSPYPTSVPTANQGSTSSPTPAPKTFDLNKDKRVNSIDGAIFLNDWRSGTNVPQIDYNGDQTINSIDFAVFKANFSI